MNLCPHHLMDMKNQVAKPA